MQSQKTRPVWITIRADEHEWSIPLNRLTSYLSDGRAVLVEEIRRTAESHGISLDHVHAALNAVQRRKAVQQ